VRARFYLANPKQLVSAEVLRDLGPEAAPTLTETLRLDVVRFHFKQNISMCFVPLAPRLLKTTHHCSTTSELAIWTYNVFRF
jgi:hypothetical protein